MVGADTSRSTRRSTVRQGVGLCPGPRTNARRGQCRAGHALLAAAFAVALACLPSACGIGNEVGSPGPTGSGAASPSQGPTPGELAAHLARCAAGIDQWKESAGKVDYPKVLEVTVGQSTTYNAAIDVGDAPLPADQVITVPSGEATSEPITIKCGVVARLVPIGDITVSPTPDSWVPRSFSPSGVAEWAWTVTTSTSTDKSLMLEIQPAHLGNDVPLASGDETVEVFTRVEVASTWIDRTSDWFADQWPKLVAVVGIVAGAVAGAVTWLGMPWPPSKWFSGKRRTTKKRRRPATPANASGGRPSDRTPTTTG